MAAACWMARAVSRPCLRTMWVSGNAARKPDIDGERCPARVRLCGQRADQVGFTNVEDVGEAGHVLPGNAVTIGGGSHGLAQCDCGGREHVVLLGAPETRRRGADNGGECMPCIFDIEIIKHRGDGRRAGRVHLAPPRRRAGHTAE